MAVVNKTLVLKNSIIGRLIHHQSVKFLRKIGSSVVHLDSTGNCSKESGQTTSSFPPLTESCPQPSPCPETPTCPPSLCPPNPDPGNPCNYCPPPCQDGPDLTRLKKNQCHFQKNDGLPVYLKGGPRDTIIYQAILIGLILSIIVNSYLVLTLK